MSDLFIGGTIRPGTTEPVTDARDAIDGWRSVANAAARLALTTPYLRVGMVVVEQDTLDAYQLTSLSPVTWAPLSTGGGGAFLWSVGKTWTTLWAEIQAGGGFGTVYIPSGSLVIITGVGPYNLNGLKFVGLGDRSELDFDPGVLVDAGTDISLTFENLLVFGQAPMMTPGSKEVNIQLVRSLFSNFGGGAALFSTSSTTSGILSVGSSIGNAFFNATDAIFNLTAPAARVVYQALNGGFNSQVQASFGDAIIGNAAATVAILTDALTQYDVFTSIVGPITESLFQQYSRLGLPNYTTANLPAPSVFRKGQVAYDTTVDRPKWCDSSAWKDFGDPPTILKVATTSNETVPVDLTTIPPNSGALIRIEVVGVSSYFSAMSSFTANSNSRRDGSGDGSVSSYTLIRSAISPDLTGVTIQVPNTHVAGVVQLNITGRGGRPIWWTIKVTSLVATQNQ